MGAVRRLIVAVAALVACSGCAVWRSGGLVDRSVSMGGACERIGPMVGAPEDIAADPDGGYWVSASDWRAHELGGKVPRGEIYRLTFEGDRPRLTPATRDAPADFQPHGLDLWVSPSGEKRLFVVSHPIAGPDRVEIFRVVGDKLELTADGGAYEALFRPNDVAAFGPRSFFATNDHDVARSHWFHPHLREQLEDVFGWRGGFVVRVSEGRAARVATGLALPNGIVLSADGKRLFVAESAAGAVREYTALDRPSLRLLSVHAVGPGPDNLSRDRAGRLWIGAHNNGLAFLRYATRGRRTSPGRVVIFDPTSGQVSKPVYQSGGAELASGRRGLSATSVGLDGGDGRVLVGNIFTPALERCAIAP